MNELIRAMRLRTHAHRREESEAAALAEIALWSATADGVLEDAEVRELCAMLVRIEGLTHFDEDFARGVVAQMAERYRDEAAISERVLSLCVRVHDAALRARAYQLALWSAARDGHFSEDEAAFLESLQEALELSDDEADALAEVVKSG